MRLAVTGATGYIGSSFVSLALKHGHEVVVLSRKIPSCKKLSWVFFDLLSNHSIVLPSGINAVIHLAFNSTATNDLEADTEVLAAQRLMKSSHDAGARFVFISSQTAQPDAPTAYGRIKWRIEQDVLSAGGWVVRPGQVYGAELRGLFAILVNAVHRLPMLPAFLPSPTVQPIHVDDLAMGLLRIVAVDDIPPRTYCLGAPEPVLFSTFLEAIAKWRLRCWRVFFPMPIPIINALMLLIGQSKRKKLGLERLQSLFNLPAMKTQPDLNMLKITLRPLQSGMHRSGSARRRDVLQEGKTLLTYVLKQPPSSHLLRRYIKCIELLRNGQALGLPPFFLAHPFFLSLIDPSHWSNKKLSAEFSWRLDAVTTLAEATPQGAPRFLDLYSHSGALRSIFFIAKAITSELFWRVCRVPLVSVIRFSLRHADGDL